MEGVGRIAAVRARVGQRPDHPQELDRRAGPAVGEDQGQRVGLRRAHVDEVDPLAVGLGDELRQLVELGLAGAPVEFLAPVARQALQVLARDAPAPADARGLAGPAGAREPVAEVLELGVGDVDAERADVGHDATVCGDAER